MTAIIIAVILFFVLSGYNIVFAGSFDGAFKNCMELADSKNLVYAKIELADGTIVVCGRGKEKNSYKYSSNTDTDSDKVSNDYDIGPPIMPETLSKFMMIWNEIYFTDKGNYINDKINISDLAYADNLISGLFTENSAEKNTYWLYHIAATGDRYKSYWLSFLPFATESEQIFTLSSYIESLWSLKEDLPSDNKKIDAINEIKNICVAQIKDFCRQNINLGALLEIRRLDSSFYKELYPDERYQKY